MNALPRPPESAVALAQALFCLATGLWPLFDLASFEAVTGPKTDDWLVVTVGLMIAVVGTALLVGALRRQVGLELRVLAVGSALALLFIDLRYVLGGRIGAVYLLDALAEAALMRLNYLELARGLEGARRFWQGHLAQFEVVRTEFGPAVLGEHAAALEWLSEGTLAGGHPIRYRG